jgi:hypothetical protein
MFNTRVSAIGFLQYSSTDDLVGLNLRLRYNPREGDDLHVVYDQSVSTLPMGHEVAPPGIAGRTLLLKYSRTLTLLARNR